MDILEAYRTPYSPRSWPSRSPSLGSGSVEYTPGRALVHFGSPAEVEYGLADDARPVDDDPERGARDQAAAKRIVRVPCPTCLAEAGERCDEDWCPDRIVAALLAAPDQAAVSAAATASIAAAARSLRRGPTRAQGR